MPSIIYEPGDYPFPNLLLFLSNFADEQYLSFLVCGSHHLIVAILFVQPMNDLSCVLSSNLLGDDVMGYISHPNVLSSWMLVFYHTMKSEVRYYLIHCVFCIYGLLLISLLHITIYLHVDYFQKGLILQYCVCLWCVFHYFH